MSTSPPPSSSFPFSSHRRYSLERCCFVFSISVRRWRGDRRKGRERERHMAIFLPLPPPFSISRLHSVGGWLLCTIRDVVLRFGAVFGVLLQRTSKHHCLFIYVPSYFFSFVCHWIRECSVRYMTFVSLFLISCLSGRCSFVGTFVVQVKRVFVG